MGMVVSSMEKITGAVSINPLRANATIAVSRALVTQASMLSTQLDVGFLAYAMRSTVG